MLSLLMTDALKSATRPAARAGGTLNPIIAKKAAAPRPKQPTTKYKNLSGM
jgi:hypothetical protein